MYKYTVKRVLLMVPTLIGAAIFVFGLLRLIPGNVCELRMAGEGAYVDEEAIKAAHYECQTTQFDNQTLIELLTAQSEDLKIKLVESRSRTQIAKYIAIGLGAVAIGTSAYLIAR